MSEAGKARAEAEKRRHLQQLQRLHERRAADPVRGAPNAHDVEPGRWLPGPDGMPPDSPVRVLGQDGKTIYVLDVSGQLIDIEPSAFGQKLVQAVFGDRQGFLEWAWPQFDKAGKHKGFATQEVSRAFYHAAAHHGLWDPRERLRGRGAWLDEGGALVLHCGDLVIRNGMVGPPRDIDGFCYPARPAVFAPWGGPVPDDDNPAVEILTLLKTWSFRRPIDAFLVFGWLCSAFLGPALPVRPTIFMLGDKAVGKTTLQDMFKIVLGGWLISTPETTAAGIYQHVGFDGLGVAVDEIEADADNQRQTQVLKLARLAYSPNGVMLRGGQSHKGFEFTARSSFAFSAINAPPLGAQDFSRMAVVQLDKLNDEAGVKEPRLKDPQTVGPRLLRRLMDGWPQFEHLFAGLSEVLRAAHHDSRGRKTFGTLLACAYLALGDEGAEACGFPTSEHWDSWADALAAEDLIENEAASENWRACLTHLLTSPIEVFRHGSPARVGQVIADNLFERDEDDPEAGDRRARKLLAQAGLGLVQASVEEGQPKHWYLAVPIVGQAVAKLYRNTRWGGEGALGVWTMALRQGPRELIEFRKAFSSRDVGGVRQRCTLIDLTRYRAIERMEGEGLAFDAALYEAGKR